MNASPLFLSPDYLLLKKAYECLKSLAQEKDEVVQALEQRLNDLYPSAHTTPVLEPLISQLFSCEYCGSSLQVVRVARTCETIAIDKHTGQLIWASELLTDKDVPSFEVQDAYVTCLQCHKESTRVSYDWQQARLTIGCRVCGENFFLEEGGEVLKDVQGHPCPICSPTCKESFLGEP